MRFESHGRRTRVFVWIAASVMASCGALQRNSAPDDGRRGEPIQLERLQVGSIYGVGSGFRSDGLEFAVEGFGEGLGNTEISTDSESASGKPASKNPAKTLRLSHATLRCRGEKTHGLEFDYVDNGGPVGLVIGAEQRTAADFIALDGAQIAGVTVAVSESSTAGVRRGRVSVSGEIKSFAIAGADLELVDLRLSR